jgi:hypothetical protein
MARAAEVVALRALGLSLAQVARVLAGDQQNLATALAAHEAILEQEIRRLVCKIDKSRGLRADIARGQMPADGELARLLHPTLSVGFELPWPWGGELFELHDIRALNYITGPLGSGKTRLALRLTEAFPNAAFLGLDRLNDGGAATAARLNADSALRWRVNRALDWLTDERATRSEALITLLVGLETEGPAVLVVDMVEHGLDRMTQHALSTYLRQGAKAAERPLFLLTRSTAILDLAAIGADEAVVFCPANHSPPTRIAPYPGTAGYEAVATCLASPEVRERTAGTIAWRAKRD